MEENLIDFELNKNTLKEFDKIMELHLDKIENLTVNSVVADSKFLNIIGLCTNVKNIKIVGDLKVNTNNIFSSVFNPDLVTSVEFDGVRLPTIKSFSKFKNIKNIVIKNIKYSSIKGFLALVSKENVESLYFENTDFCRASISLVNDFKKIKYLTIKKCENCKFDSYDFLSKNKFLDKVEIDNASVGFEDLGNFVKGKAIKIISGQLGKTTKKTLVNKIFCDENGINVIIHSVKLKELAENINFNRINKMILNLNKNADLVNYLKLLRRVKTEVIISIKNLSYLTAQEAEYLKEQLNIKSIKIVNSSSNWAIDINDTYDINTYIEIRNKIDDFTKLVSGEDENPLEKIVKIYKAIMLSEKKEISDTNTDSKNQLNGIIQNSFNDLNYAELLANCLTCLNIENKIIKGQNEDKSLRYWNQIKIYDYWYNVDLFLDSKTCLKEKINKKPKYFLNTDKEFYKDHKPKSSNFEPCVFELDKKVINEYFKESEQDENKEKINFWTTLINKIKKLFLFNNKSQEALPAPVDAPDLDVKVKKITKEEKKLKEGNKKNKKGC